ncbi:MAG: PTS sugar transporter subunit IIA [Candidatus Krumholzibacteriia bacterium]
MDIADVLKHTSPELFLPDLKSNDKQSALEEMVDGLVAGTTITRRETILQMLHSREELGSTAVGPGVAFPHGRTLAVQKLTILMARAREGIDFDSEDGEPTYLFFVLIAPPQDSGHKYIKSLAALTERLQDSGLRDRLMAAEDFESFCGVLQEG